MKLLLAMLCLSGCVAPPDGLEQTNAELRYGPLGVARELRWPGGGIEWTLTVKDSQGMPAKGLASDDFSLWDLAAEGRLEHEVRPFLAKERYLALLVSGPASGQSGTVLLQELEEFIAARPTQDKIAIYWMTAAGALHGASFTSSRDHLAQILGELASAPPSAPFTEEDWALALQKVSKDTLKVGGKAPQAMRAVVGIGLPQMELPQTDVAIILGLEGAASILADYENEATIRLAGCGPNEAFAARLALSGRDDRELSVGSNRVEESQGPCSPLRILREDRRFPSRISFAFTDGERKKYAEIVEAVSTADFGLSVLPEEGVPSIAASAHLRGKGTLACERKNYTLSLEGRARLWLPDSRSDEFYLLSMCADDRYVEQATANRLASQLGLFPLKFSYVELVVDGTNQGIYLLLEKAREELVRDGSAVESVLRRRFSPPDATYETKFDETPEGDAAEGYANAIGSAPLAELANVVDVQQVLTHLAFMSATENGDFVDEVWLYGSSTHTLSGERGIFYQLMAWDMDDLFSACHFEGKYAFEDVNGLAYCAESKLGQRLLGDPEHYQLFARRLKHMLEVELTPQDFNEAADSTLAELLPLLHREGVAPALTRLISDNPDAVDPVEAERDIRAKLVNLKLLFAQRRQILLQRLQAVLPEDKGQ